MTPSDPHDLESILGVEQLWLAHAGAMAALDAALLVPREEILQAWSFNVQSLGAPLDPQFPGSPASNLPTDGIVGTQSIATDMVSGALIDAPDYMAQVLAVAQGVLPGDPAFAATGAGLCAAANCAAVGRVQAGAIVLPQYQAALENEVAGSTDPGDPIPGAWNDPLAPTLDGAIDNEQIETLVFTPAGAAPQDGFPVVIFGHGITRSNKDAFAIASQLATAGMATVAINWVAHGSRAVITSVDPAEGCAGDQDPTDTDPTNGMGGISCFQPAFSDDLAQVRDNFRQSVLDGLGLVEAIKACTPSSPCGSDVAFDSSKIGYLGQSLGGILGSMMVASSSDIKASVLNVTGAGWVDILENTDSTGLRCSLVDNLIAAGVLMGDPSDISVLPPTGLCFEPEQTWKTQPGWLQFSAIGRWLLDPAEPANYVGKLAARRVLIQEVLDDAVVPNVATDRLGALLQFAAPADADVFVPASAADQPTPSAAIMSNPLDSNWLLYSNQDLPGDVPINTYEHGSVLAPAVDRLLNNGDGTAGTAQMQTDAITYLGQNLLAP